jgi:hypothetical protein
MDLIATSELRAIPFITVLPPLIIFLANGKQPMADHTRDTSSPVRYIHPNKDEIILKVKSGVI